MADHHAKIQYKYLSETTLTELGKYIFPFICTAKILHIGKTAAVLGIDPATLSRQLTRYEKLLEVKLLERNNKKITLTKHGKTLLELVEPAYDNLRAAMEIIRQEESINTSIKFGFPISLSTAIPELVQGFHHKYPSWKIELFPGYGNQLMRGVRNNALDLAVVAPLPQELDDLVGLEIGKQYLDFIYGESLMYAFQKENNAMISPSELQGISFIGFPPEFWIRKLTDKIFTAAGVIITPTIESSDLETVIGLVECGLGGAIVPRLKGEKSEIFSHAIDSPYAKRTIGIIHKNPVPKTIHIIHTYIRAYFADWLASCA